MKQIIIKTITIFFIIATLITVYIFIYYHSNQDVENVKIEGYVFDSRNSLPLNNVSVTIINERYESETGHKNYDEYLGNDKIKLRTNDKGYYHAILKKSAYVYVVLQKPGYKTYEEKGKYAKKLLVFKTYMNMK